MFPYVKNILDFSEKSGGGVISSFAGGVISAVLFRYKYKLTNSKHVFAAFYRVFMYENV